MSLNETHDPELRSWVSSANIAGSDFPIQNLPFASLRKANSEDAFQIAVAIGDYALDLSVLHATGIASSQALDACQSGTLNALMSLGHEAWSELRLHLSRLLREGSAHQAELERCLLPLSDVEYAVPATIGDYTDFFTSIHHATNVGKLFRRENPILPNYEWVPIGYHGRSSSIVVSGQSIRRPIGQLKPPNSDTPVVEPCKRLDYELEVGIFVGKGNPQGEPIAIEQAENHIFGLCLLNDWSARDIQIWENQPLGPFLAKNFASTISPWVVTMEALAPFRAPFSRDAGRAQPLPYLESESNRLAGGIDMALEVQIQTSAMREKGLAPQRISQSNLTDSFWTVAQLVTHHTVNGCNLKSGDLLGTGTMSGATEGSEGALIEITRGGTRPLELANGQTREFLEDGDTVMLTARCERNGYVGVGFGAAEGTVSPARTS